MAGQAARVTRRYIAMVRTELESAGVPAAERIRPLLTTASAPSQPGRARTAILIGARTPAEVAAPRRLADHPAGGLAAAPR